ncbi:MAG: Mov34/MPN/PAD-1 family protein [Candidatus Hermodarchaeota archaeon]
MELIEEEYKKIIETFPNALMVNDFIYHIKIPLINDVFLDIDFKKYPKRPKVILIKSNGETYKNLEIMILTLMRWKKKDAPSIIELIKEIIRFVEGMQTNEIFIKSELLDGILALCQEQHPREILGLLRREKGVVTEFILPPGALTSDSSGIFFPSRIPHDSSIEGTIHSHPSGNINPSIEDLNSVFKTKEFHFILGYPYSNYSCVKCFNKIGNEIPFKLID